MQLSGLLGSMSAGLTPSTRQTKPASSLQGTQRNLNTSERPSTIGPQKKRRQLTAQAPQQANPYGKLNSLLDHAVRGTSGPGTFNRGQGY